MQKLGNIESMLTQSAHQVTDPLGLVAHLKLLREILATGLTDEERAELTLERFLEALTESIESSNPLGLQMPEESLENQWKLYSCWFGEAFLLACRRQKGTQEND